MWASYPDPCVIHDNPAFSGTNCMNNDNELQSPQNLPAEAVVPINRCNIPAHVLAGLPFQKHAVPLAIDGIAYEHRHLFSMLQALATREQRSRCFMDYMSVQFRLHNLEDAGLVGNDSRGKADYLRILRGWMFDSNSQEGAVLKGWVESRFGLTPRFHKQPIRSINDSGYQQYQSMKALGLYGSNALESQLDLLYSFCQYEMNGSFSSRQRITLYRGLNRPDELEILKRIDQHRAIVLLNNVNSFSASRERAEEFGDYIITVSVPWQKVIFFSGLLPNYYVGEREYIILGGLYDILCHYW